MFVCNIKLSCRPLFKMSNIIVCLTSFETMHLLNHMSSLEPEQNFDLEKKS